MINPELAFDVTIDDTLYISLFPCTEVVDPERPTPTDNQVLSMENFLPTRTQQLTILQPLITVYIAQHENCDISKKSYKTIQKTSKVTQVFS